MAKQWYVVHAYSGFEKSVQRLLRERIEQDKELADQFGEILVPVEEVVDIKAGQRKISERKFFPGYVLVQMEMSDKTWHVVKSIPKVTGFIGGTGNTPSPITQEEVDDITRRIQDGVEKPKPKVLFEVGQRIRVIDGPFNDFDGIIDEVNYERSKVRISVQIFGRDTPVELSFNQIERL